MASLFDPVVGAFFRLDVAGKATGVFMSIEGGHGKNKLVEHRYVDAGGQPQVNYVAGPFEPQPFKLARAITGDGQLIEWRALVEKGQMLQATVNASIVMCRPDGTEVSRINLMKAWPSELTYGKLDAKDGTVITETVTIVWEEIEYKSTGQTESRS
jgi:phage tail-like protein